MILAIDQSLANTGMIWVTLHEDKSLTIDSKVTLKSKSLLSGNEASLSRAEELFDNFCSLFTEDLTEVIYEVPPLGNLVQRPESSLLSALALRLAARDKKVLCVGVNTNKAKKLLTGSAQARKPKVREALLAKYPVFQGLNQHQVDAASLVVTYLTEKGAL